MKIWFEPIAFDSCKSHRAVVVGMKKFIVLRSVSILHFNEQRSFSISLRNDLFRVIYRLILEQFSKRTRIVHKALIQSVGTSVCRYSTEWCSFKLLQNSQKNTFVGVSFLIKLQGLHPAILLKKRSNTGSFH